MLIFEKVAFGVLNDCFSFLQEWLFIGTIILKTIIVNMTSLRIFNNLPYLPNFENNSKIIRIFGSKLVKFT